MALLEFYGEGCPHCVTMHPLVEKLEKEHGVKFEKYEAWHNDENRKKMMQYAPGRCMGVPFFFNTETEEFICGATDFEDLKDWAGIQ